MQKRDLLRTPRRDGLGRLLDRCGNWGGVGVWAAKLHKARKKQFLATLKAPQHASHVRGILQHEEGRDFDAALKEWAGIQPAAFHVSRTQPLFETPGADAPRHRSTVVINTVDRSRHLALTLESLSAEWDSTKDELIIVLGPTGDDSDAVLRLAGLQHRLIRCPERNLAVSRNLGLQASSGSFVVFLDDDASPEKGWLEALLTPLERDLEIGVSAGFVLNGSGQRFLNRYVVADTLGRALKFPDETSALAGIDRLGAHRAFLTATGCNMAFRRQALNQIGGFDPAYRYFLEETDAVWRVLQQGYRCMPAPQSLVRHRLGTNLARKPDFKIEDRLVIIRSLIHYIDKFGKTTFSPMEIEACLWERALLDLGKIGWDCAGNCSFLKQCGDLQSGYLRAVAADLKRVTRGG